ncbi:MAG: HEAT repeat domain-containing protein [Planktothrix sp.]
MKNERTVSGNPQIIAGLIQVIQNTHDEVTRWQAIASLGKIGVGNPQAIAGLVQVIQNTQSENTRMEAAEILRKIDPENPNLSINVL